MKSAKVINIAHRGASGRAPENTLASFKKALEIGVDAIELDVRISRDGHLVVIHDDTVDRTTNGRGKVTQKTLQELKELDAGSWFHPTFSGEQVPTFHEVMDLIQGEVRVCVEIKVPYIEEKVVQAVEDDGLVDKVVVLSFIHPIIKKVKQLNPRISTGALVSPGRHSKFVQKALKPSSTDFLLPPWNFATLELIEEAHRQGLSVIVWTVDEPQGMSRMMEIGVDGIATNYPGRLKKVLASQEGSQNG